MANNMFKLKIDPNFPVSSIYCKSLSWRVSYAIHFRFLVVLHGFKWISLDGLLHTLCEMACFVYYMRWLQVYVKWVTKMIFTPWFLYYLILLILLGQWKKWTEGGACPMRCPGQPIYSCEWTWHLHWQIHYQKIVLVPPPSGAFP